MEKRLKSLKIDPKLYLKIINSRAKKQGYFEPIKFSTRNNKKLMINHNNKIIHFGNNNYNDFIIYLALEYLGIFPEGYASKRRELYLKRAKNIKGNWKNDLYSPNNLSISILW